MNDLHRAAQRGDTPTVQRLIRNRADIEVRTPEKLSALIFASKEGHMQVVQALLADGAHPNPPDNSTHTAIRAASLFGHGSIVQTLLRATADPNHTSAHGKTALMGACMRGHAEVASVLVAAGAHANAANSFGETALTLAEANGHHECKRRLLPHLVHTNKYDDAAPRGTPPRLLLEQPAAPTLLVEALTLASHQPLLALMLLGLIAGLVIVGARRRGGCVRGAPAGARVVIIAGRDAFEERA